MLKLEVPVHITDMAFTPGSGGHEIFTVTAHRHVGGPRMKENLDLKNRAGMPLILLFSCFFL